MKLCVERGLLDAVMLVLAAAGCQPRPTPSSDLRSPNPSDAAPLALHDALLLDTAVTAAAPELDAAAALAPSDASIAASADAGAAPSPGPDAAALCAAHKRTKPTAKAVRAARSGGTAEGYVYERALWHERRGLVFCTIARDTVRGTVRVTITPRCCPSPGGPAGPCPPSYQVDTRGTKVLVEYAQLKADGSVVKSDLEWVVTESSLQPQPLCGRRSEGIAVASSFKAASETVGERLARLAELEAASVPAFERLARELAHHGAPAELVRCARRAVRDEIRHARTMTQLAARRGATPRPIEVEAQPVRDLLAIARENAVEGCVREAYGALVATYQSVVAEDPAVRRASRSIGRDERAHAALAEDVDRWIITKLAPQQRAELAAVRAHARAELRDSLASTEPDVELGMPGGRDAVALFDAYFTRPPAA